MCQNSNNESNSSNNHENAEHGISLLVKKDKAF